MTRIELYLQNNPKQVPVKDAIMLEECPPNVRCPTPKDIYTPHNCEKCWNEEAKGQEKYDELGALAKPLQDWLMANFNPHCRIEIDCQGTEVLSGEMYVAIMTKTAD
ncbi:MAG: hypothetical protein WC365_00750 [Candidatus Babeliales bacterium]